MPDGAVAPPLRRSLKLFPCHRLSNQSTQRIAPRFITFAVLKRSPKRLKYSAPRFTKEDGLNYVEVDPSGSDSWKLDPIVELLKEGAVGVIPTDTAYSGLDFVVDAGRRVADPFTVVDMTGSSPHIVRKGKGP